MLEIDAGGIEKVTDRIIFKDGTYVLNPHFYSVDGSVHVVGALYNPDGSPKGHLDYVGHRGTMGLPGGRPEVAREEFERIAHNELRPLIEEAYDSTGKLVDKFNAGGVYGRKGVRPSDVLISTLDSIKSMIEHIQKRVDGTSPEVPTRTKEWWIRRCDNCTYKDNCKSVAVGCEGYHPKDIAKDIGK